MMNKTTSAVLVITSLLISALVVITITLLLKTPNTNSVKELGNLLEINQSPDPCEFSIDYNPPIATYCDVICEAYANATDREICLDVEEMSPHRVVNLSYFEKEVIVSFRENTSLEEATKVLCESGGMIMNCNGWLRGFTVLLEVEASQEKSVAERLNQFEVVRDVSFNTGEYLDLSGPTKIKPWVYAYLENQTEVHVVVTLRENEELQEKDFDSLTEKHQAQREYNLQAQAVALESLGEDFKLKYQFELMNAFTGKITINGAKILEANPEVVRVEIPGEAELAGYVISPEDQIEECIEQKKQGEYSSMRGYVPAKVSVLFRSGINKTEAKSLIESYGLNVSSFLSVGQDDSLYVVVNVPEGLELEWMCRFERNENVRYTTLEVFVRGSNQS